MSDLSERRDVHVPQGLRKKRDPVIKVRNFLEI